MSGFAPRGAAGSGRRSASAARHIAGQAGRLLAAGGLALLLAVPAARAEVPLAVELVTAEMSADRQSYSLTGEIVARDTLTASFPSGGRVAEVMVQDGDVVAQGSPLARMDSVQQEQSLRAAEAGLSTAEANHLQAVENLQRQVALLERGATTRAARDSAEDALHVAEGGLTQAQADLDRARTALDDTVLLAPTDATVIDRMVEPGQVVGAAQSVMELALGRGIDAVFDLPEVLLTRDLALDSVDLVLLEHPDVHFAGQLREVSPLVDPDTGTVEVTVSVLDPPARLAYGDAVRGTGWVQSASRIMVPYAALTSTAEGPAVWVADPVTMAVALRQVTVGRFTTQLVLVAEGLEAGALVVTRGAQLLYPGRTVRQAETSQ